MRYIYCHPLFDERKCAHRFSYQLSKAFEKKDMKLERFDYRGTGEAKGRFSDVTIESLRKDLKQKASNDDVCLIGTRFGGTVVFDYCCTNKSGVETTVLIEPVINGYEENWLCLISGWFESSLLRFRDGEGLFLKKISGGALFQEWDTE